MPSEPTILGCVNVLEELLNLLLPTRCALCRRLGAPICETCVFGLGWQPHATSRDQLMGAVASFYGEVERDLVKSFKEHGQTSLLPYLAQPMTGLLIEILARFPDAALVPVPSGKANFLKRGFSPAKLLAQRVNSSAGRPTVVLDALKFGHEILDQSKLDSTSRHENLRDSMVASSTLRGREVIIIDDIVTTGATILEAARAATAAGAKVVGFLAFSETILKTQSKT